MIKNTNVLKIKDLFIFRILNNFITYILVFFLILTFQVIIGIVSVISLIPLSSHLLPSSTNFSNKYVDFFFKFL